MKSVHEENTAYTTLLVDKTYRCIKIRNQLRSSLKIATVMKLSKSQPCLKIGFSSVSWSLLDRVGNNNSTFSYICDQICCIHTGLLSSAYFPISQHSIHMAMARVGWPGLSGWSGSLPCPVWLLG